MKVIIQCLLISCLFSFQTYADVLELDIHIKEHKFYPEILEVPAGVKIRLNIYNDDDTIEEFDSIDLKREKIILPKSSARIILAPLKPGKYHFIGEFNEDTAQGDIIVTAETNNQ